MILQEHVPLAPYTTLRVGGSARYFTSVATIEELTEAALFAQQQALPLLLIGGGSNLLISDEGFSGVVIKVHIQGVRYEWRDDVAMLTVGAGVIFDELVSESVKNGLWGLENLSCIPGTVGATPVQNVGAYGVEVSQLIESVTAIHLPTQSLRVFTNDACRFGYRDSFFKSSEGSEYGIVTVQFRLSRIPQPRLEYADVAKRFTRTTAVTLARVREVICAIRAEKFPDWHEVGTAGSFFKNPIITKQAAAMLLAQYPALPIYPVNNEYMKCALGYILDKVCNLKGYRVGAVRLFEKQALVVVAERGASAAHIVHFAHEVSEKVFSKTGIRIEWEVRRVEK